MKYNHKKLLGCFIASAVIFSLNVYSDSYNLFQYNFKDQVCNYPNSNFFMKNYTGNALSHLKDNFITVKPNEAYSDFDRLPINEDVHEKEIIKSAFSIGNTANSYSVNRSFLENAAPDSKSLPGNLLDKILNLKRVDGYMFHGSGTSPAELKKQGGICNKYPSLDIITYWVAQPELPHPGWISFTKSISIAKKHASTTWLGGHLPRSGGWIYVFYVEGGFEVPSFKEAEPYLHIKDLYARKVISNVWFEQEITVYRSASWSQVVAYRAVNSWGFLEGKIYVREGLKLADPVGFSKIVDTLSGKDFIE